jgi:hypothetical protein
MSHVNDVIKYLNQHRDCHELHAFDKLMRYMLTKGFDHEDAKDMILEHCELSAITFRERILNCQYLVISLTGMNPGGFMERVLYRKNLFWNRELRKTHRLN